MGRRDKHLKRLREREQRARDLLAGTIIAYKIPIHPKTADWLGITSYKKANHGQGQETTVPDRLRPLHSGEGTGDRAEPSDGSDTR